LKIAAILLRSTDLNTRRSPAFPTDAHYLKSLPSPTRRGFASEHDQHVIQMNEVRRRASGPVQRAAPKVAAMIDETGHPTGHLAIP
jgi:hypothetical protein